jgi:hypothetical protein
MQPLIATPAILPMRFYSRLLIALFWAAVTGRFSVGCDFTEHPCTRQACWPACLPEGQLLFEALRPAPAEQYLLDNTRWTTLLGQHLLDNTWQPGGGSESGRAATVVQGDCERTRHCAGGAPSRLLITCAWSRRAAATLGGRYQQPVLAEDDRICSR